MNASSRELRRDLSITCLQWDGEPPAAAFRARSGGIFVDMGVHEFDQARWLWEVTSPNCGRSRRLS